MKRSLFSILALCALAVCLSGCGGSGEEPPDGYSKDKDMREPSATPIESPSKDVGDTIKGD